MLVVSPFFNRLTLVQGNKGGTAIRMTFTPPLLSSGDPNSTTFTFVNSHLAAFDEQYDKRNSDFQDLSKRLKFESEILDATTLPITLYESDILFWMVCLFASVLSGITHFRLYSRAVCT